MMSRTIRVVVVIGFVLAAAGPSSAATWPVPRGASHEPHPYQYDSAIWKTVPAEFLDDAPACILYASTTNLVEPDGTIETITHELTRTGSRKSVEKLGEFRGNAEGKLFTWSANNLKLLPRDEDRPSKEELRLQVACSTFASWDAVGEWKRKLRAECWECTPLVKQTVAEVTRNLKTSEEKA